MASVYRERHLALEGAQDFEGYWLERGGSFLLASRGFGSYVLAGWQWPSSSSTAWYANFLSSDRRDAWQLRHGAVYREAQVSRARMEFQRGSAHVRAVLSGAACSLAAYYVMASGQQCDLACPFCADQVPTWSHLVWERCAFQEIRGGLLCPDDAVAARLGWPTQINGRWSSGGSSLMAAVRAAVLERIPA